MTTTTLSNATQDFSAVRRGFHALTHTDNSLTGTVLRIVLGIVMLPHGLQKVAGLFGGYGFAGTMGYFTDTIGLPWLIAFTVIAIEFAGALALIAGVGTRIAAAGIAAVMTGAVVTVHATNGFFMNWAGTQAGEGFEYHLLAIAIAVALMIIGGGRWSVDRWGHSPTS